MHPLTETRPPQRVRLKDIAEEAHLSLSAVSMALRSDATIAAGTAKRVQEIAKRMGYVPDPALSALSAYRSKLRVHNHYSVIALVTNWSTKDAWSGKGNQQEVIRGARKRAEQLGYSLQLFWAKEEGMSGKRFSQILRSRGVKGLILAPLENNDDSLDLEWKHFSVVTISRPSRYTAFHHVVQNHYMDMINCWNKLAEKGYQRVGLVLQDDIAARWSYQWDAAHLIEASELAPESRDIPILRIGNGQGPGVIKDWLSRYQPEAVVSRYKGFLDIIRQEGFRAPDDFGYVSLDTSEDPVEVSGMEPQRDALGAMAVDALNSLLHRNFKGFNDISVGTQVDGIWREGETLPAKER